MVYPLSKQYPYTSSTDGGLKAFLSRVRVCTFPEGVSFSFLFSFSIEGVQGEIFFSLFFSFSLSVHVSVYLSATHPL